MLTESGVNTQIFGAHSTRHSATSAAARNGAKIELIRKAAHWITKSNVFTRFYNLPVFDEQEFSLYVMNK